MNILIVSVLFFIPTVCNAAFGGYPMQQRPGLLGALTAQDPAKTAKEQNASIANLKEEVNKFTEWLNKTGILEMYTRIKDDYNSNADIEKRYGDAMRSTSTASIKPPAGYRLPKHRYHFTPLSDVLEKYALVIDVLDEGKRLENTVARNIVDAKRLVELRDWLRDHEKKYLLTTGDEQAVANSIKALSTEINNARSGIELYLDMMGLSLEELKDNPNDLKDMAQDVEGLLKTLNENELAKALETLVVQRYSGNADAKTNPFTFPLDDATITDFAGIPFEQLSDKIIEYRQLLFSLDMNIRNQAMQKSNVGTDLTPLAPKKYFAENFVPPSLDQMQNSTLVHEYMFDGYLGYWLQTIVNKLHELKLAGTEIIITRLKLKDIAQDIHTQYLGMLLSMASPAVQNMPIMINHAHDEIAIAPLKQESFLTAQTFTKKYATDFANDMQKIKSTLSSLQKTTPLVFSLHTADTAQPVVKEIILLRRTLLLTSLFNALLTEQPFSPATYTTDVMETIPAYVWPTLVTVTA